MSIDIISPDIWMPRLRIQDSTLTYDGLLLEIVTLIALKQHVPISMKWFIIDDMYVSVPIQAHAIQFFAEYPYWFLLIISCNHPAVTFSRLNWLAFVRKVYLL